MTTLTLTTARAKTITGGTGKPSKMPGLSIGLSANGCNVGSKLAQVPGSVCFDCYALKGQYQFRNVKEAHARRLDGIYNIRWTPAMVQLIKRQTHFRWHDAGDLQSESHLIKICAVAMLTPNVKHWLPTKEYALISAYKKKGGFIPSNLVIRLSAPMVGDKLPSRVGQSSMVLASGQATLKGVFRCNASHTRKDGSTVNTITRDNKKELGHCGDCRQCWNPNNLITAYPIH